jgi:twitching motility protein PilT
MYGLLRQMKKVNGTELRITPGLVPQTMVKGRLIPLSEFPLEPEKCRNMCYALFTDAQKSEFEKNKKLEFAFGVKDIGRYKVNIISIEGKVSGTFATLILDKS